MKNRLHFIFKICFLSLAVYAFSSCSSSYNSVKMDKVRKHFYPMPSSTKNMEKEWVIILPGYSGLKVFKDTGHYFRAAEDLNAAGFDVIIVEYKKASKKGGYKFPWEFAKGVKWATEQAIEWGKSEGYINPNNKGHIVSWSAGGEGAILLMNDSISLANLGITSVAMYYPSNRDSTLFKSNIPVLIQTGELDNVTPAKNILSTYAHHPNVELIVYPNAHHGFDVTSVVDEKHLQIPPLIGKKFTFQYDKKSALLSREHLYDFLKKN